jgi:hypothetical protein
VCGVMLPNLGEHLAALEILTLDATQQQTDVVAGHALVERLVEHLDAGHGRLGARFASRPMISTSSPTLISPRSIRPVRRYRDP